MFDPMSCLFSKPVTKDDFQSQNTPIIKDT
jgi:hypothetical protein